MPKTKSTKEAKPAKTSQYYVSMTIYGRKYEAKGSTLEEALGKIKIGGVAKSKVILSISNGKETKERVMLPFTINKLISLSPSMKAIAVKQIATLFNL